MESPEAPETMPEAPETPGAPEIHEGMPMHAEPGEEHEWLHGLIGDWTFEAEAEMGPGEPPTKSKGTESVRSLGDLWVLAEGEGEMPYGRKAEMLMTLGYDPAKERYLGTWIGSMMTHMFVYEGTMDAEKRVLTLETEGPDMSGEGGTARYRDVIEMMDDDHRVLRSLMLDEDGEWHQFMEARYRRR